MKRRIIPGSILALSVAVVLLAATASTASANRLLGEWYCPPPATPPTTLTEQVQECLSDPQPFGGFEGFGDRQVGTTSPAQRFALGVFRNDSFNPRISVSGDYAQTNNCPPTLSAGAPPELQGCLINVTFAPTGTGPKHGTLSTGPGGPTAALTGTGVTTPTPWDWPLELFAGQGSMNRQESKLKENPKLWAITNNDSTLVVSGGVKKTTIRLAASEKTKFKVKLKHLKQLEEKQKQRDKVGVKIKFAATDEFGQTATAMFKTKFCRKVIRSDPWCDLH
jgi:hypothetical protein